jgi:uncharacterized Zn finger protein (UPF0148 family)
MPRKPPEWMGRGKPCPICYLPMIERKGLIVCPNHGRHEANRKAREETGHGAVQAA